MISIAYLFACVMLVWVGWCQCTKPTPVWNGTKVLKKDRRFCISEHQGNGLCVCVWGAIGTVDSWVLYLLELHAQRICSVNRREPQDYTRAIRYNAGAKRRPRQNSTMSSRRLGKQVQFHIFNVYRLHGVCLCRTYNFSHEAHFWPLCLLPSLLSVPRRRSGSWYSAGRSAKTRM